MPRGEITPMENSCTSTRDKPTNKSENVQMLVTILFILKAVLLEEV